MRRLAAGRVMRVMRRLAAGRVMRRLAAGLATRRLAVGLVALSTFGLHAAPAAAVETLRPGQPLPPFPRSGSDHTFQMGAGAAYHQGSFFPVLEMSYRQDFGPLELRPWLEAGISRYIRPGLALTRGLPLGLYAGLGASAPFGDGYDPYSGDLLVGWTRNYLNTCLTLEVLGSYPGPSHLTAQFGILF